MPWPKGKPYPPEMLAKRTATLKANGKRDKKPLLINDDVRWRCPTCSRWLRASDYHPDCRTSNGLKSQCKRCHSRTSLATRDVVRHREANRLAEGRRRARKANAPTAPYGREDIDRLLCILGDACLACGSREEIQMDHIVPLARGGIDHPANFQPLCRSCNERKQARTRDHRTQEQQARVKDVWVLEFRRVQG